jgi:CheY-like chemotaxis protein
LYVEDEMVFRNLVSTILSTELNYKLDLAQNGVEGVKKALAKDYDIVIMDIMMPDIDGVEATIEIKKHKPYSKIVSLSALDHRDFDGCGLFDDHIRKPIRSLEFKKALSCIVNKYQ